MTRPWLMEAPLADSRDSKTTPSAEARQPRADLLAGSTLPPEDDRDESTLPPADEHDESTLPPADERDESTLPPAGSERVLPSRAAPWSARELLGCELGAWRVEALLGEGSWGAVFRGRDDRGRLAAIKVPKLRDPTTRRERLARFLREIECVRKIHATPDQAPHVVGFLEADPDGQLPWLALELLDGLDLAHELSRLRKLSLERALEVGLEVVAGLGEAHAAGVVHRDLKPSNVLLDRDGHVRLADFGVARPLQDARDETWARDGLTVTGQQLGTLHYMSPEAIAGQTVGAPTDLYSLGVLLFRSLAGRPPFRGTQAALYHAHLFQVPPALDEFVGDAPPELVTLIAELLAKSPERRPTLDQVRARIQALADRSRPPKASSPPAAVALELRPDDVLRDEVSGQSYTIVRELGRGGMGIVYEAYDPAGTRYALKVAGFAFSSAEEARARLIRDARLAIQVSVEHPHPNVARVHHVAEAQLRGAPLVFLVSELVAGPSLRALLDARGPLEDDLTRDLFLGVTEGLAAVHGAGVLHLDLTPSNVLLALDPDDPDPHLAVPKLVDFGISRTADAVAQRQVEGNPRYMSPEQCAGERPTTAADLYMWGATCYHLATGRPPFSGEPVAVMDQHRRALPPLADLESPLGHDLALIVQRCLCKLPEDRYASAEALAGDLRSAGTTAFPRAELRRRWQAEQARLAPRPGRKLVVTLALLALVLGGGAGWSQVQRSDDQVRALTRRIQEAAPSGLAALGSEVATLDHYDDGTRVRLTGTLTARAEQLVTALGDDLRQAQAALVDEPGPTQGILTRLRDQNLAALREALGSLAGVDGQRERLAALRLDLDEALGLAAASADLNSTAPRWDAAREALDALDAHPALAAERDALELRWEHGTQALESAWSETARTFRAELERKSFHQARQALEAFAAAYPSHEHLARLRAVYQAEQGKLEALEARNPHAVAAELLYERSYRGLIEPGWSAWIEPGHDPTPGAGLPELALWLEAQKDFLAETVGAGFPVARTPIGEEADRRRRRGRGLLRRWSSDAWRAFHAELRALATRQPPGPPVFHAWARELDEAPQKWAETWARDDEDSEIVVEVAGAQRTWAQLLTLERARLARAIERAWAASNEAARERLHDAAQTGSADGREEIESLLAEAVALAEDPTLRARVDPVAAETNARLTRHLGATLALFERLDQEALQGGPWRVSPRPVSVEDYRIYLDHLQVCLAQSPADPDPGLRLDQPARGVPYERARAFVAWAGWGLPPLELAGDARTTADEWCRPCPDADRDGHEACVRVHAYPTACTPLDPAYDQAVFRCARQVAR